MSWRRYITYCSKLSYFFHGNCKFILRLPADRSRQPTPYVGFCLHNHTSLQVPFICIAHPHQFNASIRKSPPTKTEYFNPRKSINHATPYDYNSLTFTRGDPILPRIRIRHNVYLQSGLNHHHIPTVSNKTLRQETHQHHISNNRGNTFVPLTYVILLQRNAPQHPISVSAMPSVSVLWAAPLPRCAVRQSDCLTV